MSQLIKYIQYQYYTDLAYSLLCLVALFISVRFRHKHKILSVFQFYFGIFTILNIVTYVLFLCPIKPNYDIDVYFDYIFTIVEFATFVIFFKSLKTIPRFLIYLIIAVFTCITTYTSSQIIYRHNLLRVSIDMLFTTQAVCLLIPCVIYFLQIFKNRNQYLQNDPGFWVMSGLGVFMITTLPFSIFMIVLLKNNQSMHYKLFVIFNLSYVMMFLMMIRAYMCKPLPQTKNGIQNSELRNPENCYVLTTPTNN